MVSDSIGQIVDLSGATSLTIVLKKPVPDNTSVTKPATLTTDGTDGKMEYKTNTSDLDVIGIWKAQGIIVDGAIEDNPTTIIEFEVLERL